LPLVAAGVLTINLLAAGGIGFPGVAESLWVLLALAVAVAEGPSIRPTGTHPAPPGWQPPALVAVALAVTAVGYFTAYQPVTGSYFALREAAQHPLDEKPLEAALQADPQADTAHMALAEFCAARLLQHLRPTGLDAAGAADFDAFEKHVRQGIALRPLSSSNHLDAGVWYARMYSVWREPRLAEEAIAHLGAAVANYPNNAGLRVQRGQVLEAAGMEVSARGAAQEALRLDDLMPHRDKRLLPEQRAWAERTAGVSVRAP
jgi:hypothetical protein